MFKLGGGRATDWLAGNRPTKTILVTRHYWNAVIVLLFTFLYDVSRTRWEDLEVPESAEL